jgi:hypothetical protein
VRGEEGREFLFFSTIFNSSFFLMFSCCHDYFANFVGPYTRRRRRVMQNLPTTTTTMDLIHHYYFRAMDELHNY